MLDEGHLNELHLDIDEKLQQLHNEHSTLLLPIADSPRLPIFTTSPLPTKHTARSRGRFSSFLRNSLCVFVPSFISDAKHGKNTAPPKITSTTYLNGLRGLAAFFVFCHHYLMEYYRDITFYAYGTRPEDNHVIQLPLISIIHSGSFMVSIFFILSGYVLSYKTVGLIYKSNGTGSQDANILQTLASSAFRRAPRLYIPLVIPWLVTPILVYVGYFTKLDYEIAPPTDAEIPAPTLLTQFAMEWANFKEYSNPFVWERVYPTHMSQLWTIPVEFRGSLIVFLLLVCLSKAKHGARLAIEFIAAWYCLSYGRWDVFLFIWGIIFAELRVLRTSVTNSSYGLDKTLIYDKAALKTLHYALNTFWLLLFLVGGWMGSFPFHEDHAGHWSPYFVPLKWISPTEGLAISEPHRYWATIGAVFFMLGLDHLEVLQRPFNTSLIQYLGDVSYGFYIVHWTVLRTAGRYIPVYCIAATESRFQGFSIAFIFDLALTVWLGDVQMRIGDRPSIKISRWLEKKFFLVASPA